MKEEEEECGSLKRNCFEGLANARERADFIAYHVFYFHCSQRKRYSCCLDLLINICYLEGLEICRYIDVGFLYT